jgi:hypothetical protein
VVVASPSGCTFGGLGARSDDVVAGSSGRAGLAGPVGLRGVFRSGRPWGHSGTSRPVCAEVRQRQLLRLHPSSSLCMLGGLKRGGAGLGATCAEADGHALEDVAATKAEKGWVVLMLVQQWPDLHAEVVQLC